MKNYLLLTLCFLLTTLGTLAQKNATDTLSLIPEERFTLFTSRNKMVGDNTLPLPNLVSRPSFRKIYRKDFSTLVGNNNLPVSQVIVSVAKPEIQIGQLIPLYLGPRSTIPVLGLYPYAKGSLNADDEFRLTKDSKVDPGVGFGGKLVIIPAGRQNGTGYYFKTNAESRLFIEKNNFLKKKIEVKYDLSKIQAAIKKLEAEIGALDTKIDKQSKRLDFLNLYLQNPTQYKFDIRDDQVLLVKTTDPSGSNMVFELAEIESVAFAKTDEKGHIESIKPTLSGIEVTFKSQEQASLLAGDLLLTTADINKATDALNEKKFEKQTELLAAKELLEKPSRLKELSEDEVYEIEKDAPWSYRKFFWFTLEGSTGKQSANLFRNNTIDNNLHFQRNLWGASANYATFSSKWVFNFIAKYEISMINKFFNDDPISYIEDTPIAGTNYKTSKTTKAYDVSKMSDSEFNDKGKQGIITIGTTILRGDKKKYGVNINYRQETLDQVANLKFGAILPVIMDNSKAEQTNIILEIVLPDLNSKGEGNSEQKPWQRRYYNLKVGIPINLL